MRPTLFYGKRNDNFSSRIDCPKYQLLEEDFQEEEDFQGRFFTVLTRRPGGNCTILWFFWDVKIIKSNVFAKAKWMNGGIALSVELQQVRSWLLSVLTQYRSRSRHHIDIPFASAGIKCFSALPNCYLKYKMRDLCCYAFIFQFILSYGVRLNFALKHWFAGPLTSKILEYRFRTC